jgi:carbamoyl-phosphate synthase small subunit
VLDRRPDGVFLSNGPGDPAALSDNVAVVGSLIGTVPIFGICLGHQLLSTALGGSTYKLPFGHHGSNHPVQDLTTRRIEITAQNHNYAVSPDSLSRGVVSHINLNDGVIEGVSAAAERCFSVQYHPEAGPGPHDARYLFDRFETLLRTGALESI